MTAEAIIIDLSLKTELQLLLASVLPNDEVRNFVMDTVSTAITPSIRLQHSSGHYFILTQTSSQKAQLFVQLIASTLASRSIDFKDYKRLSPVKKSEITFVYCDWDSLSKQQNKQLVQFLKDDDNLKKHLVFLYTTSNKYAHSLYSQRTRSVVINM